MILGDNKEKNLNIYGYVEEDQWIYDENDSPINSTSGSLNNNSLGISANLDSSEVNYLYGQLNELILYKEYKVKDTSTIQMILDDNTFSANVLKTNNKLNIYKNNNLLNSFDGSQSIDLQLYDSQEDMYQLRNDLNEEINLRNTQYIELINQLNTKVDKKLKTGSLTEYKVLSDNNFTNNEKSKISKIIIDGDGKKALMNDGTYNETGKVDTINNINPDINKNVELDASDIKINKYQESRSIKETFDDLNNKISEDINTHNTSLTSHNDIRLLITNIVNGTTEITKALEAKNYDTQTGTIKLKFDELIENINELTTLVDGLKGASVSLGQIGYNTVDITQQGLNDFTTDKGRIPQQGYVIYDLDDNEWEYNGTEWVNNGKFINSLATNTQSGSVIGGNEYVNILNGVITVLKSQNTDRLGGELPAYYATLGALTTLQNNFTSHVDNTNNPHNTTKAQIGLGNVDNTSDTDKPISASQQAALDLKGTKLNIPQNTVPLRGSVGLGEPDDYRLLSSSPSNNAIITYSSSGTIRVNNAVLDGEVVNLSQLNTKVDKITGKELSTNDYDDDEKEKVMKSNIARIDNSYNGFVTQPSSVSFDNSTRTLSLNGNYDIYVNSEKYNKSDDTFQITDVEGQHHIYYDESGVIAELVNSYSLELITKYCFIASIYWDKDNQKQILMAAEYKHGMIMDGDTHARLHEKDGLVLISGGELGDMSTNGDGSSNEHSQFSNVSSIVRDEDARFVHQSRLKTDNLPVYYRIGNNWKVKENNSFPVVNGSNGRACYNKLTSGVWVLEEQIEGDYLLAHIAITNDITRPYIVIMGQSGYPNLTDVRPAAKTEINNLILGGLPFQEIKFVATVIIQTSSTYTNTPKSRIMSVEAGVPYVDLRGEVITRSGVTGGSVENHNALSGIQGGAGDEYYHLTSAQANNLLLTTSQTLTTAQQNQVKTNLDIGGGSDFSGSFNDLTDVPTTLSGYGIKDAVTSVNGQTGTVSNVAKTDESNIFTTNQEIRDNLLIGKSSGLSSDSGSLTIVSDELDNHGANTTVKSKAPFHVYNTVYLPVEDGTLITKEYINELKGANNGLAELDNAGKVPSSQLPSYVDDVLEYATLANFPTTGETGKIYIAIDTNLSYRWTGTQYNIISPSLALGETSSTAYRGDRGKLAYEHSQITNGTNPHNTEFANLANKPTTLEGYGIEDGATKLNLPEWSVPVRGVGTGEANTSILVRDAVSPSTIALRGVGGVIQVGTAIAATNAVNLAQMNSRLTNITFDDLKRITLQGDTEGATRYYPIATFPVNNNGNYASCIITGRIGGWVKANMSYVNCLTSNRNGATGSLFVSGESVPTALSITDIVVYTESNASATVYLKCTGYFQYDINLNIVQGSAAYTGNYTTSPTGTLTWASSTTANKMAIYNGVAYVGTTPLIDASSAQTITGTKTFGQINVNEINLLV